MLMGQGFLTDVLTLVTNSTTSSTHRMVSDLLELADDYYETNTVLDGPSTRFCMRLINEVMALKDDALNPTVRVGLLLKHRDNMVFKHDKTLYAAMEQLLSGEQQIGMDQVKRLQDRVVNAISWLRSQKFVSKVTRYNRMVQNITNVDEQKDVLVEMMDHAKKITQEYAFVQDRYGDGSFETVEEVDISNIASLTKAFEDQKRTSQWMYKFGLNGINNMYGGGIEQGESFLNAALSNQGKSLLLRQHLINAAKYNKPPEVPEGMKPTLTYVSLENEIKKTLKNMFDDIYGLKYWKEAPDDVPVVEMVELINEFFQSNGWELVMFRKDGTFFGFEEYEELYKKLIAEKRHTVMFVLDYLMLVRLNQTGRIDYDMQTTARRFIHHAKNNNYIFTTAWQLDSEAKKLMANNAGQIATKFGSQFLNNCKALDQEFDKIMYQHIQANYNGTFFFTVQFGKNRYGIRPDYKDQFRAWRFHDWGGFPSDFETGKDTGVRDIFAESKATITDGSVVGFLD